jgi:hypothetical protein
MVLAISSMNASSAIADQRTRLSDPHRAVWASALLVIACPSLRSSRAGVAADGETAPLTSVRWPDDSTPRLRSKSS